MENAVWKSMNKRRLKKRLKITGLTPATIVGNGLTFHEYWKVCRQLQRRFLRPLIVEEARDAN